MCCVSSYAQTVIQMEEYGGVFRIPCKVNGAKMKLIFDTGADKVCLSLTMAEYLFDNDFISLDDIVGSGSSTVADGSIVDHIKINIKDIEIQGIHLKNVEAVVIDGQNAPLLLGQSAIKKLGKYSISGNKLIISTSSSSGHGNNTAMTKTEIERILKDANRAFDDRYYNVAEEKYKILFEKGILTSIEKIKYAKCLKYTGKVDDALDVSLSIQEEIEKKYPNERADLYLLIGICYRGKKESELGIKYFEKAKFYAKPWSEKQLTAVDLLVTINMLEGNDDEARIQLLDYINKYLQYRKWEPTDCWNKSLSDAFLSELYYNLANVFLWDEELIDYYEKYLVLSAAWGNAESIEKCVSRGLNYSSNRNIYKYSY